MKKVGNWFAASWYGLLTLALGTAGIVFLLWYGLGDLLPGLSEKEIAQASSSRTFEAIVNDPLGLPHKLTQLITQQIQLSATAVRSASAIIGLISVGSFYYVVRNWYSRRVATLGTILFATSAWFLHVARIGTDSSIYLLLFAAIACVVWLQKSKGSIASVITSAILLIMLLYIPGMIWFVVPILLWQIGRIGQILEGHNSGTLILVSLLALALLGPIGWAMYQDPNLIKTYFGLPQTFPELPEILKNIANAPVQLFFRGPQNPETWLGRLPFLNLFIAVTFAIGTYAFFFERKLDRTWFILYVLIVGTVLASLGGHVNLVVVMPFIYLVAVSGVAFLLRQWFTVFPRNPFARTTGTTLMTAVVLLAAFNGFSHFFIAWPNTPETKQVYQEKLEQPEAF